MSDVVYCFDCVFGLKQKPNVRRSNNMGICLKILKLPALALFNVGRTRPSVLRALLVAADLANTMKER